LALHSVHHPDAAVGPAPVEAAAWAAPGAVHSTVHDLDHAAMFPALARDCLSAKVRDFHQSALADAQPELPAVHSRAHPDEVV
jgi:hypothetical protein